MTSSHPWIADCFFAASVIVFLAKLLTWEKVKQQPLKVRHRSSAIGVASTLIIAAAMIAGNHRLNRPRSLADLPASYRNAIDYNFSATADDTHPKGTMVIGVPWQDGFVITRFYLRNSSDVTLRKVELTLRMDAPAFYAAQISHVPNIVLTPHSPFGGIGSWEGGSLDKDGKVKDRVVATPEQLQALKDYSPASTFSIKAAELFNDIPVEIVLLGSGRNSFKNGVWTSTSLAANIIPRRVLLTGNYEIQYRNATYAVPVRLMRIGK